MEKNTVLEYLEERESKMTESAEKTNALKSFYRGKAEAYNDVIRWIKSQPESPAPLSAEESVAIEQLYDVFANWYHDDGSYCNFYKSEAAKAFNAYALTLLSQRQPVAPEREEAGTDRQKALSWFHNLPTDEYDYYFEKHYPEKGPMSDEEVEAIWRKEGKPNAPKEETVGYYFSNEHGNEVTVLSTVGEWCLVSEEGKNKPYVLPLEFVEAIRNESSPSAENKGGDCISEEENEYLWNLAKQEGGEG